MSIDRSTIGNESRPPKERVGRYRVHGSLGRGGMAEVLRASLGGPGGFRKLVAIKRIHPHLARDPELVEMFLTEARIASRINHPNVCQVLDFGSDGGSYYLAMEYLFGENVAEVLKTSIRRPRDPCWPLRAAAIVAQACEGAHAAHELRDEDGELAGVVHRDVSPTNLVVTYTGSVKVMDFGIALVQDRAYRTSPGTVKGKLRYVAPEVIRGATADRRADVWGLGVTLWEMLTLRPLFAAGSPRAIFDAVMRLAVPSPSRLNGAVPPELDAIVRRALCRDPDRRYATARTLGRDLRAIVHRRGATFDPLELEEWMAYLFPEKRREKTMLDSAILRRGSSRPPP